MHIDEAAVVRAIELSATRYCPAQAMFSKLFPIQMEYTIYEDLGDGQRKLVTAWVVYPFSRSGDPGISAQTQC